jgi:hypothetical protein
MEWLFAFAVILLLLKSSGGTFFSSAAVLTPPPAPAPVASLAIESLAGASTTSVNLGPAAVRPLIAPQSQTANVVASGLASVATEIAPLTGPAAPFVAAGAGLASAFVNLFQGCGQSCINASKINQVFYATDQNIQSLLVRGFLTCDGVIQIFQYLLQQANGSFPGDTHGVAGLQLTIQTLNAAINSLSSHPRGAGSGCQGGTPFPNNQRDYYLRGALYAGLFPQWTAGFAKAPSQGGSWYGDALDQADALTDAILAYFGYQPGMVVSSDS